MESTTCIYAGEELNNFWMAVLDVWVGYVCVRMGIGTYSDDKSLGESHHLNASHRLPVQNDISSNAIFSATNQLVVSSLVSF